MGWYDDVIGGLTDRYSGGDSGDTFDWSSLGGDTGEDGGWWSTIGNWASSFFGGGNNGGSNSTGNIFGGIMGGLNGAAQQYLSKEAMEEKGKQDRRSIDFTAALEDYYRQKNKVRKRAALDTYGQFSTMDRWAPNARPAPAVDQPAKPGY